MMNGVLWQHVVAIALAIVALTWLVRRAVKGGGSKATGPCASCPASRGVARSPVAQPLPLRRSTIPVEVTPSKPPLTRL